MKRLALAAALAAVSVFSPLAFAHTPPPAVNGQAVPSLAPIIKRVSPAVVNVSTRGHVRVRQNPMFNDPFFQQFFGQQGGQPVERKFQSLGSGVIVDAAKGYILTNNHVVENADKITVTLYDNRTFDAKVVGKDPDTDVAVLKLEGKFDDLTGITLADSDKLQVGDYVVAIGNPFGLNHTVTAGIVSALGRDGIEDGKFENFIQTDASINPGNSGGALIDLNGDLVGINTAILSGGGGNIGIGFAIPINMARTVMEQIIKYGKVERGVLGVTIQTLTPELARGLHINSTSGVLVSQVQPGSAAEKAGIKAGDVITSINGETVTTNTQLSSTIGVMRVGSPLTIGILRGGKSMTVNATIGKATGEEEGGGASDANLHGLTVSNLDKNSPLYGKVRGVVITAVDPDSEAADAGLRAGDLIVAVSQQPVNSVAELRKLAAEADKEGGLVLTVRRDNQLFYVSLGGG
ncbi:MAG TPA: DegQ family serine endoprotease [Gammaproteobacteria bacterium]|nr:DegQ family serine endoprotease [Gammaproteobacteria bacterium]